MGANRRNVTLRITQQKPDLMIVQAHPRIVQIPGTLAHKPQLIAHDEHSGDLAAMERGALECKLREFADQDMPIISSARAMRPPYDCANAWRSSLAAW